MDVTYRPTRLSTLTADLVSLFRSAIELGNIQLVVDTEPDLPLGAPTAIYLSEELWEKIIFNIVGNAFKYTMEGVISVTVHYTATEAFVDVTDTGCGIAEDEVDKIFDRFHRVKSTSRSYAGSGIGLALTHELVKILGGSLEVKSKVGVGSTFTVRLPRGFAHLPAAHVVHEESQPSELTPVSQRDMAYVEQTEAWRTIESSAAVTMPAATDGDAQMDALLFGTDIAKYRDNVVLVVDDK
jgi:hypothetical protein